MTESSDPGLNRREFVQGTVSGAVLAAASTAALAADAGKSADKAAVLAQKCTQTM